MSSLGMARSPAFNAYLSPLVGATYSLPKTALVPLLILWFGVGHLMAVAAETSPPLEEPANDGLAEWITEVPAAEKDTLLTMVADGEGAQVQALLLRRFRGSDTGTTGRSGSVRTATGLRAAAESRVADRKKAEEQRRREEQARKAAAKAAAYARRLDDLAAEGEAPWKQVDEMIATKKTSEYDRAVALLRDLRALARRQGEEAALAKRVLDLRAQYPGRPGLQSMALKPSEYFLRNIWVTTSGLFSLPPVLCAIQVLGVDRVLFSVDYPFGDNAAGRALLDALPLAPADKAKIAGGNAEQVLRIKPRALEPGA